MPYFLSALHLTCSWACYHLGCPINPDIMFEVRACAGSSSSSWHCSSNSRWWFGSWTGRVSLLHFFHLGYPDIMCEVRARTGSSSRQV